MAELVPHPFEALARRMFLELDRNDAIFDLPTRKFFTGVPDKDLSVRFHGHRASSPLGPAAGPQTQMAQNLVLSWLGGCRIMELKTVQVDDELTIPRPCIDMQTIGYNAEWSQELKLEESLEEYVKGMMLIEMLRASGRVPLADGFGDTVYDMSVGYDLAGIRSDRVQAFIHGMMDATPLIERLRDEIPRELGTLRDLDFPTRLSDTLTLSTFHGCPPDEIESIIAYLMRELGLRCVVKFNPMLLGAEEVRHLLHDQLGYVDIRVPDRAFTNDTTWEQAVAFMERLGRLADSRGLTLGAKFSNTLIVENHRGFMPSDLDEVYLSGPPLHVLAMNLVKRFRGHFGNRFPISFSAGIDRSNFADAVALGLVPITVCSDLLATGGYGRLQGYQRDLAKRMDACGATTTDAFILHAYGHGDRAVAAGADLATQRAAAMLLNTEHYVDEATANARYALAKNARLPKKIGRHLKLFDCVTCDICVPVCPNDANFTFGDGEAEIPVVTARRDDGGWTWDEGEGTTLTERHQIGTFADFCNECGNCDVFCPEDGGPYRMKPRFFGSEAAWRENAGLDGFYLRRASDPAAAVAHLDAGAEASTDVGEAGAAAGADAGADTGADGGAVADLVAGSGASGDLVLGRIDGLEFRLDVRGTRVSFAGDGFALAFDAADPAGTLTGTGPDEVDLTYYGILEYLRTAVLDDARVNVVNVLSTS